MKILLSLLISITFLFSSTEFEETYLLYKAGNYKASLKNFKHLAQEENDLDAAYILGWMYEYGEGCEPNQEESMKWYKLASRGYYYRGKDSSTRDIDKEKIKLYNSLERSTDEETNKTLKQYLQSEYNIKAHAPTYFLPLSYRIGGEYPDTNGHEAKNMETEFQVSFKYDFASDMLGLNEVYTGAYTQLSFWQLYEESAYFRETNYNPEFFMTIPISDLTEANIIKAIRLSFAHQSNGRGGNDEKSWNFISASTYFQYKFFFTELKLWHRLSDTTDYNPDLIDYMGHGHLRFMIPYKKHITQMLLRSNFSGENAVEINYSYPAFGRNDLFFYVKGFHGYGESLIDYKNYIDKIGFGFSISR